jgi:hypothetical protein
MTGSGLVGRWSAAGRLIEIVAEGDGLAVRYPGVPAEFLPGIAARDGAYVMVGGPLDGLRLDVAEFDGVPHLVVADTVTLPPWSTEPDPERFVEAVVVEHETVGPAVDKVHREFLEQVRAAGGGVVRPPDGVRVADWLRWAGDQDVLLFHGTGNGEIEQFVPRRTSYEVKDEAGRGNRAAVYATHDAWWSMWFAIVDRDRLKGSIRSGVEEFSAADGRRVSAYFFSTDHRMLPTRPWRSGWIYVLPRDGFERLGIVPGGPPSPEWVCPNMVAPLARLSVGPEDFPFLDRVCGHDDGPLLRLDELSGLLRERIEEVRELPAGVTLRLRWDDTVASVFEEYVELGRRYLPQLRRAVRHEDDRTWLDLTGPGDLPTMLRDWFTPAT